MTKTASRPEIASRLVRPESTPTPSTPSEPNGVTPTIRPTPRVGRGLRGVFEAGGGMWIPDVVARRDSIYRRSLAVADVLAATATLLLSFPLQGRDHPNPTKVVLTLAAIPLIVILGKVVGLYDRQESVVRKSTLNEAPAVFQAATLYALIFWLINGVVITGKSYRRELLTIWIVLFLLMLAFRAAARAFSRLVTPAERCLVIGDVPTCERLRLKLANRTSLHAEIVAYVPVTGLLDERDGMIALSDVDSLRTLASDYGIDRLILAPERADADEVLNVICAATVLGMKLSVLPRILEVVGSAVEFEDLEGVPLLSMRHVRLSRSSQLTKRAMDVTASLAGLVLLAPLWVAIALAIKLDSRGPVLFRQHRIGRDGRSIDMVKFRTMVRGAHEQRDQLRHLNEADGLFKIANDPRITRVGAVLRRYSLDEIPQLWNVLRGDMSLVGPRPLVAEEDQRIQGWHRRRLHLTPGMTGHWQVLGSARIPLDEMARIDYLYVTNWSLWNDVKILLRTIPYVAGHRGM